MIGTGEQGKPHTDIAGYWMFGDDLAGWQHCRTVVEYDLDNLGVDTVGEVVSYYPRWLCRNPQEHDDKCWKHRFGVDEASIKKAVTLRNRQEGAARGREARARKRAEQKEQDREPSRDDQLHPQLHGTPDA